MLRLLQRLRPQCGEVGSGDGELDAGGLAFIGFSWQARAPGMRSAMQGTVLWTASSSSAQGCSWGLEVVGFVGRGDSVHVIVFVQWRCEGRSARLLGARGVQPLVFALGRRIAGKGASANGAVENDWPASLPTEGLKVELERRGENRLLVPRNAA